MENGGGGGGEEGEIVRLEDEDIKSCPWQLSIPSDKHR